MVFLSLLNCRWRTQRSTVGISPMILLLFWFHVICLVHIDCRGSISRDNRPELVVMVPKEGPSHHVTSLAEHGHINRTLDLSVMTSECFVRLKSYSSNLARHGINGWNCELNPITCQKEKTMISRPQLMVCVLEQVQPDSKPAEAFSRPSELIRKGRQ